jgi:hypothetical protein
MSFRLLLLVLFALSAPVGAQAQDSPAERRAAAERYAEVSDLKRILSDSYQAMAQNLPAQRRDEFVGYMSRRTDLPKLNALMVDALVQNFTTEELKALAAFWGSPAGQAMIQKFPKYMGTFMPTLQMELLKTASEFR